MVQPGTDPRLIALDVGAGLVPAQGGHPQGVPLRIAANGNLVVGTDGGEVIFHKPVVYQPATDNGLMAKDQGQRTKDKHFVDGHYVLKGDRVAFEVASYDKTRPLVIDPTLAYSTYLGGSGFDIGTGVAVDASGNAYIAGWTTSSNFPTTPGAFQTAFRGSLCCEYGDAFVSKLNAAGSALVYSTYLGGSDSDGGFGVALDASGNAYITGITFSSDFPTTPGAFQSTFGGNGDAFISKFSFAAGDTTPPVTTASLTGPKGDHGWYRGAVTVTLTATDPDDPVAATYDSVDGGPYQTYSAPFSITSDGVHHLSFYSVDAAGNQEKPHTLKIRIDATPPTVTVAANPTTLWPPNGGMVSVSISGAITDATSGVDTSSVTFRVRDEYGLIQPSGSVTLGGGGSYRFTVLLQASRRGTDLDGRLYTVTVSAEDNAGNTSSAASKVIVPHDQGM